MNFKKRFRNRIFKKVCQYPGCGKEFESKSGSAKFCLEHRSQQARRSLKKNKKESFNVNKQNDERLNRRINSSNLKTEKDWKKIVIWKCALCKEPYEVELIYGQNIYPKYCLEHRNEWKRKMYIKMKNQNRNRKSQSK